MGEFRVYRNADGNKASTNVYDIWLGMAQYLEFSQATWKRESVITSVQQVDLKPLLAFLKHWTLRRGSFLWVEGAASSEPKHSFVPGNECGTFIPKFCLYLIQDVLDIPATSTEFQTVTYFACIHAKRQAFMSWRLTKSLQYLFVNLSIYFNEIIISRRIVWLRKNFTMRTGKKKWE